MVALLLTKLMQRCTPYRYVSLFRSYSQANIYDRDDLREQHALGEEIANAIVNAPIGQDVDMDELEQELDELEQEEIDERMTKTGTVPVSDELNRLPAAANGERKSIYLPFCALTRYLTPGISQGQGEGGTGGGRRRRRVTQTASRDGNVDGIVGQHCPYQLVSLQFHHSSTCRSPKSCPFFSSLRVCLRS